LDRLISETDRIWRGNSSRLKERLVMTMLGLSRRSITTAAALVGLVSLALGAHAALNKRSPDAVAAVSGPAGTEVGLRVALVIGNGHYPDAADALAQPINDARALTAVLRQQGFVVEVVEDASRDDMVRAVQRLKARIRPQSEVFVYFGGYGIQAGRESFMVPVDAAIWQEADVRRNALSVEAVLGVMQDGGARAKLVVIDASRRNPYERRFRGFSHGLAPITAPDNALILSSASPGKVADDSAAPNSLLMTELLKTLAAPASGAEAAFSRTRLAVSRASAGAQVPSVSSSLVDDISLGAAAVASAP
jgi:uncharacterized caspase-like protein